MRTPGGYADIIHHSCYRRVTDGRRALAARAQSWPLQAAATGTMRPCHGGATPGPFDRLQMQSLSSLVGMSLPVLPCGRFTSKWLCLDSHEDGNRQVVRGREWLHPHVLLPSCAPGLTASANRLRLEDES